MASTGLPAASAATVPRRRASASSPSPSASTSATSGAPPSSRSGRRSAGDVEAQVAGRTAKSASPGYDPTAHAARRAVAIADAKGQKPRDGDLQDFADGEHAWPVSARASTTPVTPSFPSSIPQPSPSPPPWSAPQPASAAISSPPPLTRHAAARWEADAGVATDAKSICI